MKRQLRAVVHIGALRTGPHGGKFRLLELECGHYKAWAAYQPRTIMSPPRIAPKRARCILCPKAST